MNKKLKYVLIVLLVIVIAAVVVWKYINKPTKDYSDSKPEISFTFAELMKKIETDTTGIQNKFIAVSGHVMKVNRDSNDVTIEIGYDTIMSSVTCQIDGRYASGFYETKEGSNIDLKGIVSALKINPESSFGNTIEMTSCTQNKK